MNTSHYNPALVKAAREAAGVKTQVEAAQIFKVNEKTIRRAENGEQVSYMLLSRMAERYATDIRTWLHPIPLPENKTLNVDKDILCPV